MRELRPARQPHSGRSGCAEEFLVRASGPLLTLNVSGSEPVERPKWKPITTFLPWIAAARAPDGSPPPAGTRLEEVTLLLYENAYNTEDIVRAMNGYQHPDSWEGGAWLTSPSGKQAVLFAGTKSNGEKYWYGYINPDGPQNACVDSHVTDFPTCRMPTILTI